MIQIIVVNKYGAMMDQMVITWFKASFLYLSGTTEEDDENPYSG
jgi:hypothetical protein